MATLHGPRCLLSHGRREKGGSVFYQSIVFILFIWELPSVSVVEK